MREQSVKNESESPAERSDFFAMEKVYHKKKTIAYIFFFGYNVSAKLGIIIE